MASRRNYGRFSVAIGMSVEDARRPSERNVDVRELPVIFHIIYVSGIRRRARPEATIIEDEQVTSLTQ